VARGGAGSMLQRLAFRAASSCGVVLALALGSALVAAGCGKSESNPAKLPADSAAGFGGAGAGLAGESSACVDCGEQAGANTASAGSSSAGTSGAGGSPASSGEAGAAGAEAGSVSAPPGLVLRAITISQTLEIPLMAAGVEVDVGRRPVPLIAGKRALLRAFVDTEPGFVERPLIGVLDLVSPQGDDTLVDNRSIAQSSLQDELTTTFVFDVSASDLLTTSNYRVRVLEADTTPLARFPRTGFLALQAKTMPAFELTLVPLVVSGFAPKAGDVELAALEARLLALYPSTAVDVTLAPAVAIDYAVTESGEGWDDALELVYDLRRKAQPARDVFYYGMLAPAASYAAYCPSAACNTGIVGYSLVAAEDEDNYRGALGVSVFQDGSGAKDAWDTLAHELGHALGRDHSPCGVDPSDTDPDYPYANGGLNGIYGFDFGAMKLIKPRPYRDVMGYCTPIWISDYTYRGIFDRLEYIAGEGFRTLSLAPLETFRVARVDRFGHASWRFEERRALSMNHRQQLDLLDAAGQLVGTVRARISRVDHSPGGYAWLPLSELQLGGAVAVDLRPLGGSLLAL
jgi:hypothetical protein